MPTDKKPQRCGTCNKRLEPWQMEGCSHTACPNRKRLTAAPPGFKDGDQYVTSDRVWLSPSTKDRDE